MIYDQVAAGVDASQGLLQKQVSQKEASEPSELESVFGKIMPSSLLSYAEMVAFI